MLLRAARSADPRIRPRAGWLCRLLRAMLRRAIRQSANPPAPDVLSWRLRAMLRRAIR
jgi:hypothetical protein